MKKNFFFSLTWHFYWRYLAPVRAQVAWSNSMACSNGQSFQTKHIMQRLAFVCNVAWYRISETESILQIPEHALIISLETFWLLRFCLYLNVTVLNTDVALRSPTVVLGVSSAAESTTSQVMLFLRVTHVQWWLDAGIARLGHLSTAGDSSKKPL